MNATLGKLSRILDTEHFVSVVHEQKTYKTTSEVSVSCVSCQADLQLCNLQFS